MHAKNGRKDASLHRRRAIRPYTLESQNRKTAAEQSRYKIILCSGTSRYCVWQTATPAGLSRGKFSLDKPESCPPSGTFCNFVRQGMLFCSDKSNIIYKSFMRYITMNVSLNERYRINFFFSGTSMYRGAIAACLPTF